MIQSNAHSAKGKKESKPRTPRKITESYLHNAGLYYLERFAASSAHFKKTMLRKIDRSCAFHKEQNREQCVVMLDKVIEKFQKLGLLDDQIYTRAMVQSFRRRGLSSRAIHARLRAKGLTPDIIQAALHKHAEGAAYDADMIAALRLAKRKKCGPYAQQVHNDAQYKKILGSFARAGYSYGITKRILDMDRTEADLISESDGR